MNSSPNPSNLITQFQSKLFIYFNSEYRAANIDAIEELTVLKVQKAKLLSEEPTVFDECLRQMEELQEAKLSNVRKITELNQIYSKPV